MRKLLFRLILLAVLAAPVVFVLAAFEPAPALPESAALSPRQAAESKALVKRVRAAAGGAEGERGSGVVTVSRREIDGLLATAARAAPGLRGRSEVRPDGVAVMVSAPAPGLPHLGWINLRAEVASSEAGLELRSLRLGRMALPAAPTLAALRLTADAVTVDDLGTLLIGSVQSVETRGDRVTVRLDPGGAGDRSLFARLTEGVRGVIGMSDGAAVQRRYDEMAAAARAGRLPARGSVAPWIAYAAEGAAEAPDGEREAVLLALAAHCGDRQAVEAIVGAFEAPEGTSACAHLTLAGRIDLRRHFTLSAGLQAAGGASVSFGMGEVKELVDASGGGSGYSFDDIAADRSGIRWAEAVLEADAERLAAITRLTTEEATFMPEVADLPSFMQEAEFRARYGAPDSDRYRTQLAEIDSRIAGLALHR